MDNFIMNYLKEVERIIGHLDVAVIENMIDVLLDTRMRGGRVFVMGFGGSAANASHFVNDLRKLCNIEAYCLTDNVAEFSARMNDGDDVHVFDKWLRTSKLNNKDCIFILSVGGGCLEPRVSVAIVNAIEYAHEPNIDAMVLGICGRITGHLTTHGDYVVVVPEIYPSRITPHTEEFQGILHHCIVTHPELATNKTVW